jgi:inorganic phosphate transporter, PiT family
MSVVVGLAVMMAFVFAFTNGFHDAANAIATLVATRVARPGPAVAMAAVFNMLGPLILGTAVADTIASIVKVTSADAIVVIGAGLTAAVVWNTATWSRGLPSSSSHALVGGLVGAAVAENGTAAVQWGGITNGWRPVGVFGVLVGLAISPVLGFAIAWVAERGVRVVGRRMTRRTAGPARLAQWPMSAFLALTHGSNDAQKSVGIVAAVLVADQRIAGVDAVPLWVTVACAAALTAGTAIGGWRIVQTVGRRIYRLKPVDALVSQGSSASVILASSLVGAPVSTTHVVASSVVGIGVGRGRRRHVGWGVAREIAIAWVTTMPATAVLAAAILPVWRAL